MEKDRMIGLVKKALRTEIKEAEEKVLKAERLLAERKLGRVTTSKVSTEDVEAYIKTHKAIIRRSGLELVSFICSIDSDRVLFSVE